MFEDLSYIHHLILSAGDVWGNLVSSLVFSHRRARNTTESNATCGILFCSQEESANPNLLVTDRTKVLSTKSAATLENSF